jgi:hypothetical protein
MCKLNNASASENALKRYEINQIKSNHTISGEYFKTVSFTHDQDGFSAQYVCKRATSTGGTNMQLCQSKIRLGTPFLESMTRKQPDL